MKTWAAVLVAFVLSASAVHAATARDYFPLDGNTSWTWSMSNFTFNAWTARVLQSANGMAWVKGLPGLEGGVWLTWAGTTLYAWNPSDGAWKVWLRFGAAVGTSYTVFLETVTYTNTKVTVLSKSDKVEDPVLGLTFYNCVRFSCTQMNSPDPITLILHFAPGIGLVQMSSTRSLGSVSGTLLSAVLGGKKFGKVHCRVVERGQDWNTQIPLESRTETGPGGAPVWLINDAATWEMAKKNIRYASTIPVVDWRRQTVIIVMALEQFNSMASVLIEDVRWDFKTQVAIVKARVKSPKEGLSSVWYTPYAVILAEEKVPQALWQFTTE